MAEKDNKTIFIVIVVIAVILLAVFLVFPEKVKTILEHKEPADISDKEKGTGLDLKFYDKDGNEIEIPDWFKVSSILDTEPFTIVQHPPAPPCVTKSQCSGYCITPGNPIGCNPNIMCWEGSCVLGNVVSMDAGVNVENPSESEISFLNVAPTIALPTAFWNNIDRTSLSRLDPGETVSWGTATSDGGVGPFNVGAWEGQGLITFSITVSGTNEYTGEAYPISDLIKLSFAADPTGGFIINIETPVPKQ